METKYIQTHDIANTIALIDAAAKQGLIDGSQLLTIGAMRMRFVANISSENLNSEIVSE